MAVALWIELGGKIDEDTYSSLCERLELRDDPPDGLIFQGAGPSPMGGWCALEVWDSREHWERFFEERVEPAMAEITDLTALDWPDAVDVTQCRLAGYSVGPGPMVNAASM